MRHIRLIALLAITACAPVQQAEVSKNAPTEALSAALTGLSVGSIQGFSGGVAAAAQRGNQELARDFLDLEYRMESGHALAVLTRFEGPISVALTGDIPTAANGELALLLSRFRAEVGLNIAQSRAVETASIVIEFVPRAQMQRVVPNAACFVVPRVRSFDDYKAKRNGTQVDWSTVTERQNVAIFIPSDTSAQEVRDCLHEELAQALGPLNDLYHLTDSVFNDDNFNTVLTSFDMLMLRLHYAPSMQNGMNEAQAAQIVPALLSQFNPAGDHIGGDIKSIAPRAWVNAVEVALGGKYTVPERITATNKMISIASAQGWNDGRMAFGYYARGRANVGSNPTAAVEDFAVARRIYQQLPGTTIHLAHIDMQLSAVALSTGQNQQAIAYADRAIPAIKRGENAALLATVMLIKSEALGNLGEVAAAQSLRLDSLGWARYGFGSDQQMRARMNEISSLGARGKRG